MEIHKALALCVEFTPTGRRVHLNTRIELRTALQVIVSYYTLTVQSTTNKQTIPDMELEKAIFSELKMSRVPCVFEQLTKFPMQTHSGKVDRLKMRREALELVKRRWQESSIEMLLQKVAATYADGVLPQVHRLVYQALYEAIETLLEMRGDMDLNFIGLDSLNTVNFVGIAQELGLNIDRVPEHVAPGRPMRTIQDLIDYCELQVGMAAPINSNEITFPSFAAVELLDAAHQQDVAAVFGPSFAHGIVLHEHVHISAQEMSDYMLHLYWAFCITSGCSFVVRDTRQSNAPIVSLVLAFD